MKKQKKLDLKKEAEKKFDEVGVMSISYIQRKYKIERGEAMAKIMNYLSLQASKIFMQGDEIIRLVK